MNTGDSINWFHGKLSREDAENLLKVANKDGTFLVRESNTAAGDFVLTLIHKGDVCHYQIRKHGEDAFFSIEDNGNILHGLETLVEFYKQNGDGLVTTLINHIPKDPPPNDSRSHGTTNLLHRAVMKNNHVVVSELLKCGYRNVNAKNQYGQTAVHLAALHGDENILNLLINAGVNINCMDTDNYIPLHYACRKQSATFIRSLVDVHANVQGRNIKNGYVPLHEAAKYGNLEAVQELLVAHAPLLPRTVLDEFPIDLAKQENHTEVVQFLENYKLQPPSTHRHQWYHGTLRREEAIEVLKNFSVSTETMDSLEKSNVASDTLPNEKLNASGCFLVRFSDRNNTGSGYVLTLLYENTIKNFIISKSSKYLYIDDGPFLPSLEHLVEHFMRFSDGLPVNLKYPVMPKPKPPLPLFSTMPRINHNRTVNSHYIDNHGDGIKKEEKNLCNSKPKLIPTTSRDNRKTKTKEAPSISVFNTLRLRSPKKGNFLENLSTLRKNNKLKSTAQEISTTQDRKEFETEQFLKDLTFCTDFNKSLESPLNTNQLSDNFYNVPKNNVPININANSTHRETGIHSSGIHNSSHPMADMNFMENRTNSEVEYFTKSDILIEQERSELGILEIPAYCCALACNLDSNKNTTKNAPTKPGECNKSQSQLQPQLYCKYPAVQLDNESIDDNLNLNHTALKDSNYFVDRKLLELEYIIGGGEFGSVYKGYLIQEERGAEAESSNQINKRDKTRIDVAIKTLRDEHYRSNKEEFLREAAVMIQLKHHCIVQLIGISKGSTLMIVQELVPLGSMLQFILSNKEKINPNYELKLWASQIACGMQFLEAHHFVHRDLAARNILLASKYQAKISDFGLSRTLGDANECYQATQGGKWPIKWYAPESYNNGIFSHASDVWSYGVTLWEMFSLGEIPYGDIRGIDAIQLIEKGQRLNQPLNCPQHIYEIMQNCWNYKAKDRPTFRYLTEFFARDPDYENIIQLIKTKHIN